MHKKLLIVIFTISIIMIQVSCGSSKPINTFSAHVLDNITTIINETALISEPATPQIEKVAKENADKARKEVLPAADSFTEYTGKLNNNIVECYVANNKCGIAITSTSNSFGGQITVITGIDKEGAITKIKVLGHADTAGLGTKAMTSEYLKTYKGIKELTASSIKEESNIDYVVGATVSSEGVFNAVKAALQQYKDYNK